MDSRLVEETLAFMQGVKTSEVLSTELRNAIYAPVVLDDGRYLHEVLSEALKGNRDVVVTGTAGGGKTMLVDQVLRTLEQEDFIVIVIGSDVVPVKFTAKTVLVIRDLTAVGSAAAAEAFTRSSRPPMLVAANEGAMMAGEMGEVFSGVISDLHSLQIGSIPINEQHPVVVDMAAIDPIATALPSLFNHQLIHAAARLHESNSPGAANFRTEALNLLADRANCEIVSNIIRNALGPGEITFSKLWNFISDVMLGGTADAATPDTVWFWRIFYGDSLISQRLREALKPEYLSLPSVSLSLYKGDVQELNFDESQLANWIFVGTNPEDCDDERELIDLMRWLRLQYVFILMLSGKSEAAVFLGARTSKLNSLLSRPNSNIEIAQAMNRYFRTGTSEGHLYAGLELWVDLMVERKQKRSYGIVSLGKLPATSIDLVPSQVIANLYSASLPGSRKFLRAKSNAPQVAPSIEITTGMLRVLSSGKTLRKYNRSNDDVEAALNSFYCGVARSCSLERHDVLNVLFARGSEPAREIGWSVDDKFQKEAK